MLVFEVYEAKDGFRWHATARNGRIMSDSGEAYTRAEDAQRALNVYLGRIERGEFRVVPIRRKRSVA